MNKVCLKKKKDDLDLFVDKARHLIDLPEEISFRDLLTLAKKTEEEEENNEKGKEEEEEGVRTLELGAGGLQFSQKVHYLICSLSSLDMAQRNISPAIQEFF